MLLNLFFFSDCSYCLGKRSEDWGSEDYQSWIKAVKCWWMIELSWVPTDGMDTESNIFQLFVDSCVRVLTTKYCSVHVKQRSSPGVELIKSNYKKGKIFLTWNYSFKSVAQTLIMSSTNALVMFGCQCRLAKCGASSCESINICRCI